MSGNGSTPDYTRLVADADVLASDLLVGGTSRTAIDFVRTHSWLDLVATDPLLGDAEAVIRSLADSTLADDWREAIDDLAVTVEQPPSDHPALAAAYRGDAMHVISMDERLGSAEAGASLRAAMNVSVRTPAAFVAVFDPKTAYETTFEASYPGPDMDPRA